MGLFSPPILTKKRRKQLDLFRKDAIKALHELSKKEKNHTIKVLYADMAKNVLQIPLYFYDAHSLHSRTYRIGKIVFGTATKGEHVKKIMVYQQGKKTFVKKEDYINLPAEHIFHGDKLSMKGILTLAHEYGHFPKKQLDSFAASYGLSENQAEELLADILSAKLAVKMGYPRDQVIKHYTGRAVVYGTFPFHKFIKDATK